MAKDLSMNGRKKIETLQKEFTDKFNFLTLIFLDEENKSIDVSKSLSEVRISRGPDISIIASLKVTTLEKRFNENFGLKVEVAYSKNGKIYHTKDSVDKTLNELNNWCELNGYDKIEFKKKLTQKTLMSVQEQLFNAILREYPDAISKKINKDNYVDIHLPSVNPKRGTHLFFNTAKNEIKLGFYVRDEEFVKSVLENSEHIEEYAQGVRISGNPTFTDVDMAVEGALLFLEEIFSSVQNTGVKKASSEKKVEKIGNTNSIHQEKEKLDIHLEAENDIDDYQGNMSDLLNKILSGNVSVNWVVNRPELIEAVANQGDLNLVKKILKNKDTDINIRDTGNDGYTAVHFAAWDGKSEILEYLLKAGADPDIVGTDGDSALHLAAATGKTECVRLLLNAGVDIERRRPCLESVNSVYGDTPLRAAFMQQHWPIVDLLVENKANILSLLEPCSEAIDGETNLFIITRKESTNSEPRYMGKFDKNKIDKLELLAQNFKNINSDKKSTSGDENIHEVNMINKSQQNNDKVNSIIEYSKYELSDLDITYNNKIDKIVSKIENEKCLINLNYVNRVLREKGYKVDNHQAYFFLSDVVFHGNKFPNENPFLVVNMDGFYSNIYEEDEIICILSWDNVLDMDLITWTPENDRSYVRFFGNIGGSFIQINTQNGYVNMGNYNHNSIKLLYHFYKIIWKDINNNFLDQPMINWNKVWEMGIKEISVKTPEEYSKL